MQRQRRREGCDERQRHSESHRALFSERQDSWEKESMQCVTVSLCLYAQDIHVVPGMLCTHTVETHSWLSFHVCLVTPAQVSMTENPPHFSSPSLTRPPHLVPVPCVFYPGSDSSFWLSPPPSLCAPALPGLLNPYSCEAAWLLVPWCCGRCSELLWRVQVLRWWCWRWCEGRRCRDSYLVPANTSTAAACSTASVPPPPPVQQSSLTQSSAACCGMLLWRIALALPLPPSVAAHAPSPSRAHTLCLLIFYAAFCTVLPPSLL